jgi:hypothetical protein
MSNCFTDLLAKCAARKMSLTLALFRRWILHGPILPASHFPSRASPRLAPTKSSKSSSSRGDEEGLDLADTDVTDTKP